MQIEIQNSLKALQGNNLLIYPTDTVWGIGCDATSESAVAKVFQLKQRSESKSLIILVDGIEMLKTYVPNIPEATLKFIETISKPTTIIYQNPIGLAKNVIAQDNTVAIRIVQNNFCKQLLKVFEKPIVSTSANISGKPTPKSFIEIDAAILDSVDYIVDLQREEINDKSSTILKIGDNDEFIVIRK
jgi:L-threonylcarbamoyladenylate synthase